eukprot:scaffold107652_cov53-Attheya_sp.AAC.2
MTLSSASGKSNDKRKGEEMWDDTIWPFVTPSHETPVHKTVIGEGKFGRVYAFSELQQVPQVKAGSTHFRAGESRESYYTSLGDMRPAIQTGLGNTDEDDEDDSSSILCLYRFKIWWMRPKFVTCMADIPYETLLVFGRDAKTDEYHLILPLILPEEGSSSSTCTRCTSCSLYSTDDGTVQLTSETPGTVGLYCGKSSKPFDLLQDGIAMALQMAQGISSTKTNNHTPNHSMVSDFTTKRNMEENQDNEMGSAKDCPTEMQRLPFFARSLGWCTWNAFYTGVTGRKVVDAVQTHHANGVPIRWMILDDGWQHTTNDNANNGEQWGERLVSLTDASPDKFGPDDNNHDTNISDIHVPMNRNNAPNNTTERSLLSLTETVQMLKSGLGIDAVLAWHALPGYWLGCAEPTSNVDNKIKMTPSTIQYPHFPFGIMENDSSASREQSVTKGIGIANDATQFLSRYHAYLQGCGIDGVKVDAQAVTGILRPHPPGNKNENDGEISRSEKSHAHEVALRLHAALALSMERHFGGARFDRPVSASAPIIHCMSHAPEIFYRIPSLYGNTRLPLMRASDDHYPNNPYSHGPHIVACAFNSLLLGLVMVPDWDMFTTTVTADMTPDMVWIHAIARAISGGPVYLSDKPLETNSAILESLVCKDGTVLTCTKSAVPTRDCLLRNPLSCSHMHIFKVQNVNGKRGAYTSGVLGLFHVGGTGDWDAGKLDYGPVIDPNAPAVTNAMGVIRATDVECFRSQFSSKPDQSFLALSFRNNHVKVLRSLEDEMSMTLAPMGSDAITLIPLTQIPFGNSTVEFAPLGLLGKINGAGSILNQADKGIGSDGTATTMQLVSLNGVGSFCFAIRPLDPSVGKLNLTLAVGGHPIHYTTISHQNENTLIPTGLIDRGFQVFIFQLEGRGQGRPTVQEDVSIELSPQIQ